MYDSLSLFVRLLFPDMHKVISTVRRKKSHLSG